MKKLMMLRSVRSRIQVATKAAGRRECLGLLGRRPAEEVVSAMLLLPARSSWASASAEPIAVKQAADRLAADGLVPAGLWHSHATFGVFHSGTDQETIRKLIPAMATWSYERPVPRFAAPTLIGADMAVLPTPDGMVRVFSLEGAAIPGSPDRLRAAWAEVITRFGQVQHPHQARFEGESLVLEGEEITLVLGLPPGGRLTVHTEDAAHYKVAWLHSLVVNLRGDDCVDCVSVHNCGGRAVLDQQPSSLDLVEDPDEAPVLSLLAPTNGEDATAKPEESALPMCWAERCV